MSRAFLITIGHSNEDINEGIMGYTFEETLIYVGRLLERLKTDIDFVGKYIYVEEHYLSDDGHYKSRDDLYKGQYQITSG